MPWGRKIAAQRVPRRCRAARHGERIRQMSARRVDSGKGNTAEAVSGAALREALFGAQ